MSKQTYKVCFCFRRRFRLAAAEAPEDIKAIFNEYSENGVMGLDQLQRFLVEVQKEENATLEDAQAVMDSLHEFNIFHRKGLNIENFFKYLFGDVNPPLNPKLGCYEKVCKQSDQGNKLGITSLRTYANINYGGEFNWVEHH